MMHWLRLLVVAVMISGVVLLAQRLFPASCSPSGFPLSVVVPQTLSAKASTGKAAFDTQCATCHGPNGSGSDKGPPFIHAIYNSGHHPDASFLNAVRLGVPRHHWSFGDMPLQPQVSQAAVEAIVAYVREIQRANGIVFKQHRM